MILLTKKSYLSLLRHLLPVLLLGDGEDGEDGLGGLLNVALLRVSPTLERISQVISTKLSQTNTKFRIIIQNYQITGKCSIWRGKLPKTMANYTLLKWKFFPLQMCWLVKSLDIRKWMERDTRLNPPAANTWVGRTEVWNHLASARHTTFIVNVIKRVLTGPDYTQVYKGTMMD